MLFLKANVTTIYRKEVEEGNPDIVSFRQLRDIETCSRAI
jgi:hypothetical protein